ncbi:hypothetical protein AB0L70_29740 [Kribbella sp. NPDC051952]|uniref:hypothetical protein n=1 Tax=Kribbella sp. NPDC051952 TaxID=3154851 RepID=UPI0034406358
MRFRKSVGAVALAMGTVVAGATAAPASAHTTPLFWDHIYSTGDSGTAGGKVFVKEYDDDIRVCDNEADGYGVSAAISVLPYQPLYQLHAGGNGQCSETWSAIHNLPEGTTIYVEVWLTGNSGDPYYGLKQYSYLNDH